MGKISCFVLWAKKQVLTALVLLLLVSSPSMANDPLEPSWITNSPLKTLMPGMTSLEWLSLERKTNYSLWASITGTDKTRANFIYVQHSISAQTKFQENILQMIRKHSGVLSRHQLTINSATHLLEQMKTGRVRFAIDPQTQFAAYFERDLSNHYKDKRHIIAYSPTGIYKDKHDMLRAVFSDDSFEWTPEKRFLNHTIHEGSHMWTSDYQWRSLNGLGYTTDDRIDILRSVSNANNEYNAQLSGYLAEGDDLRMANGVAMRRLNNPSYSHHDLSRIHESIDDSLLNAMTEFEEATGIPGKPRSSQFFRKLPIVGFVFLGASYGSQAYAGEPISGRELMFDVASEMPGADIVNDAGGIISVPIMRLYAFGLDKYYNSDRAARDYMATKYPFIPAWAKSALGPTRVSPHILNRLNRADPDFGDGNY